LLELRHLLIRQRKSLFGYRRHPLAELLFEHRPLRIRRCRLRTNHDGSREHCGHYEAH
jgi:hypothetical protein